jgi:hypothetical protein
MSTTAMIKRPPIFPPPAPWPIPAPAWFAPEPRPAIA